jgi:hypothetical protein
VSWEPGTGFGPVFIDHSEIAEAYVLRVMIDVERESVAAVELVELCMPSIGTAAEFNHVNLLRS